MPVSCVSRLAIPALLAILLAPAGACAQSVQPWPDLLVSGPVGGGVLLSGEGIGRIADDTRPSQLETRLHVGHALNQQLTLWVGYVHVETFVPRAPDRHENQIVEQLNWKLPALGPFRLSTRTRLEQRWLSGVDATSWRWRQLVRATVPLGKAQAPSLVFWAEPFVALNRTAGQPHDLDQLRLFAGISVPLGKHVDAEIGYLNQQIYRKGPKVVNDAVPIVVTLHF